MNHMPIDGGDMHTMDDDAANTVKLSKTLHVEIKVFPLLN